MKISLIAAIAQNNAIGKNNDLLWHLPADMQHFKRTTEGCTVITGRKNYESIPERFRPLPNRINIVVTRNENYNAPGANVVSSLEAALQLAEQSDEGEVFIIGGGEIYSQSINLANKLYITKVFHNFDGDTYFPKIDTLLWKLTKCSDINTDEKSQLQYQFIEYEKININ